MDRGSQERRRGCFFVSVKLKGNNWIEGLTLETGSEYLKGEGDI